MHEELTIFPAFVKLKIFNTQEKYIYDQIIFYYFLQQNTINFIRAITKKFLFYIFTEFYMFIIVKKFIRHQLSYYHFLITTTIKTSRLGIYFYVVSQIFIM